MCLIDVQKEHVSALCRQQQAPRSSVSSDGSHCLFCLGLAGCVAQSCLIEQLEGIITERTFVVAINVPASL